MRCKKATIVGQIDTLPRVRARIFTRSYGQLPAELTTVAVPEFGVQVGVLKPSPLATPPPVVVTVMNAPAFLQNAVEDEPAPVADAFTTQLVTNVDSASAIPSSEAVA